VNAPFTCKQLAFENSFRQAAGVYRHQGARGTQGSGVQGLRCQPLAGAVFAGNQHIGVGRSNARDHVQHRPHGVRLRDQLRKALGAQSAIFSFQALALAQRPAQLNLRFEYGRQAGVVPGFLDEVARSPAHSFHRQLHRAPRRHDDHGQRGIDRLHMLQQLQPFLPAGGVAGVVQVHQYGIEIAGLHRVYHGGGGVDGVRLVAFPFDEKPQRFQHVRLVVGNQNGGCAAMVRFHPIY